MGQKPTYDALLTVGKVFKRLPALTPLSRAFNRWRHGVVLRDIQELLEDSYVYVQGSYCKDGVNLSDSQQNELSKVWVFWWQGEADMPISVHACIDSIRRHAGGCDVVVIDKSNIRNYTNLSAHIFDLVDRGVITLTHLSDLVRYDLLLNRGGLWLDASMYVVADLPRMNDGRIFTCGGYPDATLFNVSEGRWLGGVIGGPVGHPMFAFMNDFFTRYWDVRERLNDYFLIDYCVSFAYQKNIGGFADDCMLAHGRNSELFSLRGYLEMPFDFEVWDSLSMSTDIFMISHKWVHEVRAESFADILLHKPSFAEGRG